MQQQIETTPKEKTETTFAPVTTTADAAASVTASEVTADDLLPLLQRFAARRTHRKRLYTRLEFCLRLLPYVVLMIAALRYPQRSPLSTFAFLSLLIALIVFSLMAVLGAQMITSAVMGTEQDRALARELARFSDARAVGALAELLTSEDRKVQRVVRQALIESLPLLRASDAALLSPKQRSCLYAALYTMNADFVLVLLKALEQVGDAKAIPYVERLAAGEKSAKISRKVREEAIVCLEFLKERAPHQEATETLLRASAPQSAMPDTLLRPAAPSSETSSQQLLRATDANQETGRA